ncbi:MAG: hypothetical protein JO276_09985 [Sphingomonadaceae bacterium]|nr:hypothetical protein [Sphingomonadaceae bacterium]
MSDIVGPAAARSVLDALLASIEASLKAVQGGSQEARTTAMDAAQKRLSDFINSTRPQNLADQAEVDAVQQIDDVALNAFSNLTADQIEAGVAAIQQSNQQLVALTAQLNLQTASTSAAAKSIALQPVKKAVDAMTAMVNSVKALKDNLSAADPDQAKAAAEIEKLIQQFEIVRKAVSAPAG